LAPAESGSAIGSPSSRLDGFFSDVLRFVEYNAEQPARMAYGDHLTTVFGTLPVMQEFKRPNLTGNGLSHPKMASATRAGRLAPSSARNWPPTRGER
jgi:hypothetical protein